MMTSENNHFCAHTYKKMLVHVGKSAATCTSKNALEKRCYSIILTG